MEVVVDGILLSDVYSNDVECWPVTNVKIMFSGYLIDVDVKIHCIKNTFSPEELLFHDLEDENPNIIVDLMDTEITVKSNNCLELDLFKNPKKNCGYLRYETELFIEKKLEGFAIEIFAGDIMYAIIDDIDKKYQPKKHYADVSSRIVV